MAYHLGAAYVVPEAGVVDEVRRSAVVRNIAEYISWRNPAMVNRSKQSSDGIWRYGFYPGKIHEHVTTSRGLFDFIQEPNRFVRVLDEGKVFGGLHTALLLKWAKAARETGLDVTLTRMSPKAGIAPLLRSLPSR